MRKVINIANLDCPNCAKELEEEISKISGVLNVDADFINQKVIVNFTNENVLNKVIECCNNFEEVKVVEDKKQYEKK